MPNWILACTVLTTEFVVMFAMVLQWLQSCVVLVVDALAKSLHSVTVKFVHTIASLIARTAVVFWLTKPLLVLQRWKRRRLKRPPVARCV